MRLSGIEEILRSAKKRFEINNLGSLVQYITCMSRLFVSICLEAKPISKRIERSGIYCFATHGASIICLEPGSDTVGMEIVR